LAGVPVKREEPCAAHGYGCGHQNKIVATWAERPRKTAGQTFRQPKGFGPVNRFQAEVKALVQICEKLIGSVFMSQEYIQYLYAGQVGEAHYLGAVCEEALNGLTIVVVQEKANQQT
jgi:hypothetical protein